MLKYLEKQIDKLIDVLSTITVFEVVINILGIWKFVELMNEVIKFWRLK